MVALHEYTITEPPTGAEIEAAARAAESTKENVLSMVILGDYEVPKPAARRIGVTILDILTLKEGMLIIGDATDEDGTPLGTSYVRTRTDKPEEPGNTTLIY